MGFRVKQFKREITRSTPPERLDGLSFIYVVTETCGRLVRYIGASIEPYARYRIHFPLRGNLTPAKIKATRQIGTCGPAGEWARFQILSGAHPRMFVIQIVNTNEREVTEKYWIDYFTAKRHPVMNVHTPGRPKSAAKNGEG